MKTPTHILSVFAATTLFAVAALAGDGEMHATAGFHGPKANTGTAVHLHQNGQSILRVSPDFKVPDTPAPTWRVVDSAGNIHTLDAFKVKGGEKREIVVPAYVPNIARVQVWCAFAEVLLGEASFPTPVN